MTGEFWNPMVPELTVESVEASLRFYSAAGFRVRYRRRAPEFAYIELGRAQLMLEQDHLQAWRTGPLERPLGRGINLQVEVPSVSSCAAALLAAGFPLFREPVESWYEVAPGNAAGQIEFLAQDPDGYLMRFVEVLGFRSE